MKSESIQDLKMTLRDRDTGELVLKGDLNVNGHLVLKEVGEAYILLLRQIGLSIGEA